MAHLNPDIIDQIAQSLINVPDSSYTAALAAARKRYVRRGIAEWDFDDLVQQLTTLAAASPFNDRAFILHALDVLIKIPKRNQRTYIHIERNLKREWETLQPYMLRAGLGLAASYLSIEVDKMGTALTELGVQMGQVLAPVFESINTAFGTPGMQYLAELAQLSAKYEAFGFPPERFAELVKASEATSKQFPIPLHEWVIADLNRTLDRLVMGSLSVEELEAWLDDQLAKA